MTSEHQEFRYESDDRDGIELCISTAPNGDFYIGVAENGAKIYPNVRICTSGGCSATNPALLKAIREVFQALNPDYVPTESFIVVKSVDSPGHKEECDRILEDMRNGFAARKIDSD